MKNYLFTLAFAAMNLLAFAQQKNMQMVSLGLNHSNNNTDDNPSYPSENQTQLNLGYGYFIKERVRLGLDFSFSVDKHRDAYSMNYKHYDWAVNYTTFYKMANRFYLDVSDFLGYNTGTHEENNLGNTYKIRSTGYSIGVNVGLSYFPAKHFSFGAKFLSANYGAGLSEDQSSGSKTKSSGFSLNNYFNPVNMSWRISFMF